MEIMQSVRTRLLATTASVLKDIEQNQMPRLLVNRLTSTFYVKAILTAPTTPNALKVNASVKKVLKLPDPSA